jgi:hypothetical protein
MVQLRWLIIWQLRSFWTRAQDREDDEKGNKISYCVSASRFWISMELTSRLRVATIVTRHPPHLDSNGYLPG